jgi:hypothetical protein
MRSLWVTWLVIRFDESFMLLTLGGILQVQIGFKDHMCILYQFPERLVAMLFFTGFVSAGLAAPLVGVWVDEQ